MASARGKDPAGLLFMDSKKCNHRSKDMALSKENLTVQRNREEASKRTMPLEGQESRTRKDQGQGHKGPDRDKTKKGTVLRTYI